MDNISRYLQKFRSLTSYEGDVKDACVAVISEELGIELSRDVVRYTKKRVYIRVHPGIKSELMLHKERILRVLRPRVPCVIEDIH